MATVASGVAGGARGPGVTELDLIRPGSNEADFDLLIAIPTHDYTVHVQTMAGVLDTQKAFDDRVSLITHAGFLPMVRDVVCSTFLHETTATHLLCVDSDMGFRAAHVARLLAANVEFVSGVAAKKTVDPRLAAGGHTGRRGGPDNVLAEMTHVGGAFLLLSRWCLERMYAEYPALAYGDVRALWLPKLTPDGIYESEDAAFCSRWRAIGGDVWMHTECVVDHYGEFRYNPRSVQALLDQQVRDGDDKLKRDTDRVPK